MNLLSEPWIPVRKGAEFKQISYKELLCSDQSDLQVALPRDDLELACIQMLAAMTQVIFMPADRKVLRAKIKTPLSEKEYDEGVEKYTKWFDLEHPNWPFMQVNDTGAKELTPIQKLFAGLPAGHNHAFFNEVDEISKACPSCVAIALFNQCTNCPNISGKHKAGIRGNNPVSSVVYGRNLRTMVWHNTLCKDNVSRFFPNDSDEPVWVRPILKGSIIYQHDIGLVRGLFWAPILIKLYLVHEKNGVCDCCGQSNNIFYRDFHLGSEFKFALKGLWKHPLSSFVFDPKRGKQILSFRNKIPAWAQFNEILFRYAAKYQSGYIPALVVSQYQDIFNDELHLLIGGYRSKSATDAAVRQRRHEVYTFPAGWNSSFADRIHEVINCGIICRDYLIKQIYQVMTGIKSKQKDLKGVSKKIRIDKQAEAIYFHLSEPLIHRMLRESSLREFVQEKNLFLKDLADICIGIFDQVTRPFAHKPELIGTIALARVKLDGMLSQLKSEHTVKGGGL